MIPVLYADEHLIIVEKPHNLLSVPGKGEDKQDCLWRRVQFQDYPTARIVHRLDYATSGLMVLALTAASHAALSRLFQERKITKHYQAIISGTLKPDTGSVTQPLRCDWERRPLQIVDPVQGKNAETHWQVLEYLPQRTRVRLYPVTGRFSSAARAYAVAGAPHCWRPLLCRYQRTCAGRPLTIACRTLGF